MSLFANYRADRLIAEIKSSANPSGPVAQKALEKLVALGPSAIDSIVTALNSAEKRETLAYVEALSRLIDAKTLPHVLKTMGDANGRAMSGIAWALSSSRNYPASALLDALNDYEGAVILITHDRSLIELVADRLWLTADGRIKPFVGDMDDYARFVLDRTKAGSTHSQESANKQPAALEGFDAAAAARLAAKKAAKKRRRRGY